MYRNDQEDEIEQFFRAKGRRPSEGGTETDRDRTGSADAVPSQILRGRTAAADTAGDPYGLFRRRASPGLL